MLSLFKRQVAVTGAPLMRVSFSSGFTALKKAEKDATKTTKTTKPPKTGKAAIKRPITAYAAYVADYYKQYKPSGSAVDFAQEMAAKWRTLSDAAKQPFYEINKQDSERYHAEVDAYEKTLPPKRPSNSFIRYLLDHRADFVKENPGASMVEVGKIAGAAWKKLSDAEKKPYQDAFAKAKAEYEAKHKSSD